jgi:hypothetical protein
MRTILPSQVASRVLRRPQRASTIVAAEAVMSVDPAAPAAR